MLMKESLIGSLQALTLNAIGFLQVKILMNIQYLSNIPHFQSSRVFSYLEFSFLF